MCLEQEWADFRLQEIFFFFFCLARVLVPTWSQLKNGSLWGRDRFKILVAPFTIICCKLETYTGSSDTSISTNSHQTYYRTRIMMGCWQPWWENQKKEEVGIKYNLGQPHPLVGAKGKDVDDRCRVHHLKPLVPVWALLQLQTTQM